MSNTDIDEAQIARLHERGAAAWAGADAADLRAGGDGMPAPARVPLTDSQIDELFDADPPGASRAAQRRIARAIEAAHGITAAPTAQQDPKS